ncbi:hypothetical protein RCH14_003802 [Massilia sp. MP_M2]|uniref:hypothetical protein n=1 Tax=Massilia sp. MP_M2 TaxID=3071713 RepID=UPI00319DD463
MHISEVCSIVEAVQILSALTKRVWTEDEVIRAVIRLRLPVYATAPYDASIVSKRYVDERLVIAEEDSLKAQYVTLRQYEIEELAYSSGPQVITDRPAWLFGDEPHQPWSSITAFRQSDHRVIGYWDTEQGEWMGESNEYFFSKPVQITAQSTFVVPRHTIAALIEDDDLRCPQLARAGSSEPAQPAPPMEAPVPAENSASRCRVDKAAPLGITKNQVLMAFSGLTTIDLKKALANGKGLYGKDQAKEVSGTPGSRHAALWDPVVLAAGFYENYRTPRSKLNKMFMEHQFLAPWREKWNEVAEDLV